MCEPRYVSPEQRAAWLIEKGTRGWQEIQRLSMQHDEWFDAVVLRGQELWLPHHETDGSLFAVTLRIGIHYPEGSGEAVTTQVYALLQSIEQSFADERGRLVITVQPRE